MSSCCANVLDCLFVVLNVFFLNFVLPFDGKMKLYIYITALVVRLLQLARWRIPYTCSQWGVYAEFNKNVFR